MYNEFVRLELWSDSSDTQEMYYISLGMIALKSKGAPSYFNVGFDLVCDFDLRPNGYHVLTGSVITSSGQF